MNAVSLRSYQGKKLVSFIRNGDYAHAGETESILQVMEKFPKKKDQTILDAGCGLGGTAHFIQENGWGRVTGIDIEPDAIKYAKKHYPEVEFHECDMVHAHTYLKTKFDIICLFNSFYAINDQSAGLLSLSKIITTKGKLVIFDYSDPYINQVATPLYKEADLIKNTLPFKPINVYKIGEVLENACWRLTEIIDVTNEYMRWYNSLVKKILDNGPYILKNFGKDYFEKSYNTYSKICQAMQEKSLGGAIIYAEKT